MLSARYQSMGQILLLLSKGSHTWLVLQKLIMSLNRKLGNESYWYPEQKLMNGSVVCNFVIMQWSRLKNIVNNCKDCCNWLFHETVSFLILFVTTFCFFADFYHMQKADTHLDLLNMGNLVQQVHINYSCAPSHPHILAEFYTLQQYDTIWKCFQYCRPFMSRIHLSLTEGQQRSICNVLCGEVEKYIWANNEFTCFF